MLPPVSLEGLCVAGCAADLAFENGGAVSCCDRILNLVLNCLCKSCVEGAEVSHHFLAGEGCPELEGSGSLEEVLHTLRLLYARELDENAAGVADLLDGRLGHAETVDTVAEDIERVGDCAFCILPDDSDDILVGRLRGDAGSEVNGTEHLCEPLSA